MVFRTGCESQLSRSLIIALLAILDGMANIEGQDQAPRLYTILGWNHLSMNFFLLTNVKIPTLVGILTIMSRKNSILGQSEPVKRNF